MGVGEQQIQFGTLQCANQKKTGCSVAKQSLRLDYSGAPLKTTVGFNSYQVITFVCNTQCTGPSGFMAYGDLF